MHGPSRSTPSRRKGRAQARSVGRSDASVISGQSNCAERVRTSARSSSVGSGGRQSARLKNSRAGITSTLDAAVAWPAGGGGVWGEKIKGERPPPEPAPAVAWPAGGGGLSVKNISRTTPPMSSTGRSPS